MKKSYLLSIPIYRNKQFYEYRRKGIKRLSSAPFITGDTFREMADHVYDDRNWGFDPKRVKKNDLIFVETYYLEAFFYNFYSDIAYPFFLITHNADMSVPGKFYFYLLDQKIINWFSVNVEQDHPKLVLLPFGIANKRFSYGAVSTLKKKRAASIDKKHLMYLNFDEENYPKERKYVRNHFSKKKYVYLGEKKHFTSYLDDVKTSKFVLSPRGIGLDCYRTWETLYVGSFPVVKSSSLDSLFEDLPVLIVNDWAMINRAFLESAYQSMLTKKYDFSKLRFSYWKKKVEKILKDSRDTQYSSTFC